jgi:hopanoid biosynthesis associated protein HpnK
MASADTSRRLIVNADDFGNSNEINSAVLHAHREGILTTASLMVNGPAVREAVQMAKEAPSLGVGLHLTLCFGTSALPRAEVPALVDRNGRFRNSPVSAGMVYFFSPRARAQLKKEIAAQFERFERTGLPLDHVNGHLHFHLHPAVFAVLLKECERRNIRAVRLTYDPWSTDAPLGQGRWFYRMSHAIIFSLLARRSKEPLDRRGIAHADYVFGLLENARVTEEYILKLVPALPSGVSELYSHPSVHEFKDEYRALISPRVADAIRRENIQLIRYQDLWHDS